MQIRVKGKLNTRKLVREGKATRTDGLTLSPDGRQIRCIKYLLHP